MAKGDTFDATRMRTKRLPGTELGTSDQQRAVVAEREPDQVAAAPTIAQDGDAGTAAPKSARKAAKRSTAKRSARR